jgi:hypothetical protein
VLSVHAPLQKHALTTFNVLNQEGRGVAAALLSRRPVSREEASFYRSHTIVPGLNVSPVMHAVVEGEAANGFGHMRPLAGAAAVRRDLTFRPDDDDDDSDDWSDSEERVRGEWGYSSEARWRRIHAGLTKLEPNVAHMQERALRGAPAREAWLLERKERLLLPANDSDVVADSERFRRRG